MKEILLLLCVVLAANARELPQAATDGLLPLDKVFKENVFYVS